MQRFLLRPAGLVALFLLSAAPSSLAQKVQVGYDKSADFSRFKTYSWIPAETPSTNPLVATMVNLDIDHELAQKGLTKVDHDPDLLVKSYGGGEDVKGGFAANDPGHAATGGAPITTASSWGGSLPATPVPQVMHGSITVDLVDARQKQLVWRGTARGKMDYQNHSKLLDQASKAVTAIFKKYPPPK